MLYLSTRNATDCYTAYRALNEAYAPDGGVYVPFRLQKFTKEELKELRTQAPCATIAQILNLFFANRWNRDRHWNIDFLIIPFQFNRTRLFIPFYPGKTA